MDFVRTVIQGVCKILVKLRWVQIVSWIGARLATVSRKIFMAIWSKWNAKHGNVHLPANAAQLKRLPFVNHNAWLRPTESDVGRVAEYCAGIYFRDSYLHEALNRLGPTVLVDVGANIGLSSLSLLDEFKSLKKVIGIEAEPLNFALLQRNFDLWGGIFSKVEFSAVNAIASHSSNQVFSQAASLNELTGRNSASGTFRFTADGEGNQRNLANLSCTVGIRDLIESISAEEQIVLKVDIEGGEEELFKGDNSWLRRVAFVTSEVHDKFHPVLFQSSKAMIKALVENDFAFVPDKDVIHCYNRERLIKLLR